MKHQPPAVAKAWESHKRERDELCAMAWSWLTNPHATMTCAEASKSAGLHKGELAKWISRHHKGELPAIYAKRKQNPYSPKQFRK